MRILQFLALMSALVSAGIYAAPQASSLQCKEEALKESQKLLSFYSGNDDRISIDEKVTPLAKITNPANEKQHFDILETWGDIYKGRYRMRIIYYSENHDLGCVLMGEEVLEYASL